MSENLQSQGDQIYNRPADDAGKKEVIQENNKTPQEVIDIKPQDKSGEITPPVLTIDKVLENVDKAWEAYEKNPSPELKEAYIKAKTEQKEFISKDILDRKSQEEKNKAPEKYDLKKDEKSLLSDEQVARIAAFAKEQGLTNDKAQALLNRESQLIAEDRQVVQEQTAQRVGQMQESWIATAKEDKEYGGVEFPANMERAKRVLTKYGTPEFVAILEDPKQGRFGNHPELIRIFNRIGKAMAEDQLEMPNAQGGKKEISVADKLYGEPKT